MSEKLAAPVAGYIRATNAFDTDAILSTFHDDALVNDVQREFRGKPAIRSWIEREIVAVKVTMQVVEAFEHHGDNIVSAKLDGEYDKKGLPDPLILTFYFSLDGDRISRLIILHNKAVT
ncbi:nuclear transport factor 2 family protein [Nevskia soli]|uniref:nuclear transport factor 2 family protein n=1 Tax=Nevskia soli TaxID=418856 RepID=UPI0004A6C9D8|nr:nuclear transport factor 2 family protein [Nevskia soli]